MMHFQFIKFEQTSSNKGTNIILPMEYYLSWSETLKD